MPPAALNDGGLLFGALIRGHARASVPFAGSALDRQTWGHVPHSLHRDSRGHPQCAAPACTQSCQEGMNAKSPAASYLYPPRLQDRCKNGRMGPSNGGWRFYCLARPIKSPSSPHTAPIRISAVSLLCGNLNIKFTCHFLLGEMKAWNGCVEMANVVMRAQEARPPTGRAVGIGWRDGRGQGLQGARVRASALSAVRPRSVRRPSVRPSTSAAQSSVALHTERKGREERASFLLPSLF